MRPRKFEELEQALEGQILSGALKPGDALPSQSRLCELYAISRSCTQKALDSLAEKGLIESQPGKGVYVKGAANPARPVRKFKNVAVVFHQEFRLESNSQDNFGLEMLWGVEEELQKFGANCIIRKRSRLESFSKIVSELEETEADAFIMDREFSDEQLRPLRALSASVAVLGRLSSLPFVSSSLPNHADSFLKAFIRMADEGRRSVGLIHLGSNYYASELTWAIEQAKLLRPETKFLRQEIRCPLGAIGGGLEKAIDALSADGLPEALVFSNDWFAAPALELLAKRGLSVPGDISVLGCFGLELGAKCRPTLSSMTVDAREIGRRAVKMLAASALNGAAPSIEKVPFTFIERESFRWKRDARISS